MWRSTVVCRTRAETRSGGESELGQKIRDRALASPLRAEPPKERVTLISHTVTHRNESQVLAGKCALEAVGRRSSLATPAMVYISSWQEYQEAAESLYEKSPNTVRSLYFCIAVSFMITQISRIRPDIV